MREIKFRAWDGEAMAQVVEIDFALDLGPSYWVELLVGNTYRRTNIPCNHIMQFTGLHDADGKEIYEGDIVMPETGVVGYIEYYKGAFTYTDGGGHWWLVSDRRSMPDDAAKCNKKIQHLVVIGNIHENPELLK